MQLLAMLMLHRLHTQHTENSALSKIQGTRGTPIADKEKPHNHQRLYLLVIHTLLLMSTSDSRYDYPYSRLASPYIMSKLIEWTPLIKSAANSTELFVLQLIVYIAQSEVRIKLRLNLLDQASQTICLSEPNHPTGVAPNNLYLPTNGHC